MGFADENYESEQKFKQMFDLSGTDAPSTGGLLTAGVYTVVTEGARLSATKNGGQMLTIRVRQKETGDVCWGQFNIVHSTATAQKIAKEKVKGMLIAGGFPDPDSPQDLNDFNGLKVGVKIVDEAYEKEGVKHVSAKVKSFFRPPTKSAAALAGDEPKHAPLPELADDEIPF